MWCKHFAEMRWIVGIVFVFALGLVGAHAAFGADPVSLRDPTGDAGSAPDITKVTIERSGTGGLVLTTELATMPDLQPDGALFYLFDTDRNRSTGGPGGVDFLVIARPQGVAQLRWTGTQLTSLPPPADRRLTGTGVQFTLARTDLGSDAFDLAVASTRESSSNADVSDIDVVPDSRPFSYPATVAGLVVPFSVVVTKAGGVLDARGIQAQLSSDEIVGGQMKCTLKYRGKSLRALAGGCRWRIAKNLKGKRLTLTITFVYGDTSHTQTIPVQVR